MACLDSNSPLPVQLTCEPQYSPLTLLELWPFANSDHMNWHIGTQPLLRRRYIYIDSSYLNFSTRSPRRSLSSLLRFVWVSHYNSAHSIRHHPISPQWRSKSLWWMHSHYTHFKMRDPTIRLKISHKRFGVSNAQSAGHNAVLHGDLGSKKINLPSFEG